MSYDIDLKHPRVNRKDAINRRGMTTPPLRDIELVVFKHPLTSECQKYSVAPHRTVRELVQQAIVLTKSFWSADSDDWIVLVGGDLIAFDYWDKVIVKAGVSVTIRPKAAGIISAIIGGISAISAAISSLGFIGQLIMGAIAFGIKLLLNLLFAPKQPDNPATGPTKQSYSISASRNSVQTYVPIPQILGRMRVTPYMAALPYTEIIGDDQYIHQIFLVSLGPTDVSEFKIGETKIEAFKDVVTQVRTGEGSDIDFTLYPLAAFEEPIDIELKQVNGYSQRQTVNDVNWLGIDVVWPNGLCFIGKDGGRGVWPGIIDWDYRKVGDVAWTPGPQIKYNLATQDVVRRGVRVAVPTTAKYDVRVKKTYKDVPTSPDYTVLDEVHWTAIKSFRKGDVITSPDKVCAIAIRIRATSQLNGQLDTFNCLAQTKCKAWDGSSWVANTITRDPPSLFRYVLQGAGNKSPEPDSAIDLVALQQWWTYCRQQGFHYDKWVTDQQSVYDQLHEICAAGRAMPVFKNGKWSVVWDEQNTTICQYFSPRNSWDFVEERQLQKKLHALRIPFTNNLKKYIQDERIVYNQTYSRANATEFESMEFPGVTDPDAIWKHGRFMLAQRELRPSTYTFSAGWEAFPLIRNDKIKVVHDVLSVGFGSGRVKSVNAGAQTVTVDQELTFDGVRSYAMEFRLNDATILTRTVVPGTVGILTTIPLTGTGTLPVDGNFFAYGLASAVSGVYRVTNLEPSKNFTYRISMVDDSPAIYSADTGAIPDFSDGATVPPDPFELPPTNLVLSSGSYLENGAYYGFIHAIWDQPRIGKVDHYEVQYMESEQAEWLSAGTPGPNDRYIDVRKLSPLIYTVRVRAIFIDGTFSNWVESEALNLATVVLYPADVTGFQITTLGDVSTLSWDANTNEPGVKYQIRFVPLGNTISWNTAIVLLPSIDATSVQVPTMSGTYLIEAYLPSGAFSLNPTLITTNIADVLGLNSVLVLNAEAPLWLGTKVNTENVGGELRILNNDTIDKWEQLDLVIDMQQGDGASDAIGWYTSGTYDFANITDLSQVYTSRITAAVNAYGFDYSQTMDQWVTMANLPAMDTSSANSWSVKLQVAYTSGDPILGTYTPYQDFVVGDFTARAFKWRLVLAGQEAPELGYANTTPSVLGVTISIDMPDRTIAQNNLAVGTGGLVVVFPGGAFKQLDGLAIAAQNLATGDYATITAKSEVGFTIQFFNSSNAAIARTFDYVAHGFGQIT